MVLPGTFGAYLQSIFALVRLALAYRIACVAVDPTLLYHRICEFYILFLGQST